MRQKRLIKNIKQRVRRTRNNGTLTEAGFVRFIKDFLRKQSMHWKPCKVVKLKATVKNVKVFDSHGKKQPAVFCAGCNKLIPRSLAFVDHCEPVVPENKTFKPTFMPDYDPNLHVGADYVIGKMFVEVGGLQLLCKECHTLKGNMSYVDWLKYKPALKESG